MSKLLQVCKLAFAINKSTVKGRKEFKMPQSTK